jgi:death-on-curing family protein
MGEQTFALRSTSLTSSSVGDLIDEAAALWESLAQNHPFIDGNKRTAFASTYTFLVINGAGGAGRSR